MSLLKSKKIEVFVNGPKSPDLSVFVDGARVTYLQRFRFQSSSDKAIPEFSFSFPRLNLEKCDVPQDPALSVVCEYQDNSVSPIVKVFVGDRVVGLLKEITIEASVDGDNFIKVVSAISKKEFEEKGYPKFPEWVAVIFPSEA